jgi:hypothetical protein
MISICGFESRRPHKKLVSHIKRRCKMEKKERRRNVICMKCRKELGECKCLHNVKKVDPRVDRCYRDFYLNY